ncbi:MAG TPA: hypothetical protein VNI20_11590 [Fimbriimonadaceae bacterium]|nr:hypothetical protein [Fimbriimonadaceae bacterium]
MNEEIYSKLVDLYVDEELTEELGQMLEARAMNDPALSHDMYTLRKTLEALRSTDDARLTEESSQRILMKLRTSGAQVEQNSPDPAHLQYQLPIRG